ncbi:MAG: DUF4157 domain-containing protein, partial [Proteobacteria bacterium]|nr:DUF4157 domain-containing protein [Pseudomonadota bacterium]
MRGVARGAVARAVIQRDLLDGELPAGLDARPGAVDPQQPPPGELAVQARQAIRAARGRGGTPQIVALVRQIRAGATPATRAQIEAAITNELTPAERTAVVGGPSTTPTGRDTPWQPQVGGAEAARPGGGHGAPATAAAGPTATTTTAAPAGATAAPTAAAPTAAPTAAAPAPTAATAAPTAAAPGGAPAAAPTTPTHDDPHAARATTPAGASPATAEPHAAPAAAPIAPAEPVAPEAHHEVPPAAGRALIEQELAFHDRWRAFAGHDADGAGNRSMAAGQRFAALMQGAGGDASAGLQGGMMQFIMGQGVKLATTETALGRVPGIGNIIGGGFAAYNLFSHNGAGIREMSTDAVHGIGGAFSAQNWRDSPFLTAANLVSGIKSVLEIIGNVCQILSGLAYAFAAIAALGGLLSVFFPPLAMLLPYIPPALQFGRACGAIATVALSIATGLSPIPPILRAIHIMFTSNDPITLVQQERTFHREAQGAIANYAASRLNTAAARAENPSAPDRGFYGGLQHEIGEGATTVRTSMGAGSSANTAAGLGTSDAELRNARTEAVAGGDTRGARRAGAAHFDPGARATANQHATEGAEERRDDTRTRRDQRQTTADAANADAAADPSRRNRRTAARANDKLETATQRLEHAEQGVEMAEARADLGGRNASAGNSGDLAPAALDRETAANAEAAAEPTDELATDAYRELREGAEPVRAERNARGHVQLPDPPSTLDAIDALDRQIEELRRAAAALHATGSAARRTQARATQIATGLTASAADVQRHVRAEDQRGTTGAARVTAQTTDMQTRSAGAGQEARGQIDHAASTLAGVASSAHTIDSVLMRVPSNRFFDVTGTRTSVHQFALGMDQVTGAGGQQQAQQVAAERVASARTQQVQDAAVTRAQGVAAGDQVHHMMTQDAGAARTASSEAAETAGGATAGASQTGGQLAEVRAQREERWTALLGWAAQHRALRDTVIQRRVATHDTSPGGATPHAIATRATAAGGGGTLPFLAQIQRAFGRHDVSGIRAHTGAAAERSAQAMGARAFATGNSIVLADADLHTVAHEAAHVVQQRSGRVNVSGGVGAAGDAHEQHADRVADLVVRGASAEAALDEYTGPGGGGGGGGGGSVLVQRAHIVGADTASSTPLVQAVLTGDNPSALHTLIHAMQQTAARRTPGATSDHIVCVGGGNDYDLQLAPATTDRMLAQLTARMASLRAAAEASRGATAPASDADDPLVHAFNTSFAEVLPGLRQASGSPLMTPSADAPRSRSSHTTAVAAPSTDPTAPPPPVAGPAVPASAATAFTHEELALMFSPAQRAAIITFASDGMVPDHLFNGGDAGTSTAQQRIVMSAHILTRGRIRSGSFTQTLHARMCGDWVRLVNEYAGVGDTSGAGIENQFDNAGSTVFGTGVPQAVQSVQVPVVDPAHPNRRFAQVGRPMDELLAIQPGDWLYLFSNVDTAGGNHSVVFSHWMGEAVLGGEFPYRQAVVFGQQHRDAGGAPTQPRLGPNGCVPEQGAEVTIVTRIQRVAPDERPPETAADVAGGELALGATPAHVQVPRTASPELVAALAGPAAGANLALAVRMQTRYNGTLDLDALRRAIRDANAAMITTLSTADAASGQRSRLDPGQVILLTQTNELAQIEALVRLNERLTSRVRNAHALDASQA